MDSYTYRNDLDFFDPRDLLPATCDTCGDHLDDDGDCVSRCFLTDAGEDFGAWGPRELDDRERLRQTVNFLTVNPSAYYAAHCPVCDGVVSEDTGFCPIECEHPTRGFWYLARRARQYQAALERLSRQAKGVQGA